MKIKNKSGIMKKICAVITASTMLVGMTVSVPKEKTKVFAASNVEIDLSKTYQNIRGFGGINHPEWTGKDLTPEQRETAFGNGDNQLGFTMLRIFVNPDSEQWGNALPTAKYASDHGVTVFASPWEPPKSLAESGGSKGKLHLPESNYAAYAKHLNDFGKYMKNNGVDLYSVSVQNEPDYASEWTAWSTDETTNFLANYADKITSTRVMSPESYQYSPEGASWVAGGDGGKKFYTKILNNEKAFANCDVFGTHFYGTTREWMDFPALENCGKEIWMTEVYVPNSDADSNNKWPEAIKVAENIHNGLVVGNMSAYVWWYIRRSYGPMSEDGTISKRGYCMAQYSKYVRPGYKRVECTESPEENVLVSAYKGGGDKVVIVAVNSGSSEYTQSFSLNGAAIKNVDRYRTSANENLKKTASMENNGSGFYAQLPANSVSTFIVTAEGGDIPDTGNDDPSISDQPDEPNDYGWYFQHGFEKDNCGWASRGGTTIAPSSDEHYTDYGSKSLYVSGRKDAWNGAQFSLKSNTFKAGETYSFSVHAKYNVGADVENFKLTLQYKDSSGKTCYSKIASSAAVKGKWVQLSNEKYQIPEGATDLVIYVETEDTVIDFYIDEAIGAVSGTKILGEGAMDAPPQTTDLQTGDLNDDGIINVIDLLIAKKGLKDGFTSSVVRNAADVDQSNTVDVDDIKYMQQYIVKQITEFPVAETHEMRTISEYTPIVEKNVVEYESNESKQELAGVQYGTVKSGTYYSTTCKKDKPYNILLPAGYSTNKKYPVLYVMHGYWEDQDRMIIKGNGTMYTRQIIGNAIASGEAEDMIVVFPYIYSSETQDVCTGMNDENNAAYDNFINDLTEDLMPHIESNYSVKTGRENTAITGFSMGGRESLLIGMKRPDLFGYVGAICAAPGVTGAFKWDSEKEAPSLLFITAGGNDEVVYTTPEGYHNKFKENNVPHIWHYVTNGYHGDNSIHAHIYNFARAIFKA